MSPFNRGHAFFLSGSALAIFFPIISAPIVARLYNPEAFGVYAVFFSLATILSAISSLELRHVAMLEPTREAGAHGVQLALMAVVLFSTCLWGILYLLPSNWLEQAFGAGVVPYLIWLPLTVFLMGVSQILYTWASREKAFSFLGRNKVILGGATMVLQIGIGLTRPGPIGFIIANLLGLLLANFLLVRLFLSGRQNLSINFGLRSAVLQLRCHFSLIVWTMPAMLVNTTSRFLPDLLINRFFGVAQLGQYSLAMRMLKLPISSLSSSVQQIFRQQSSEEFNKTGQCRGSFWRFFALTVMGAVLLIMPVILLMPTVFPIIFGSQWNEAGTLVQAVAFLVMVRFVSSPLSYIWIVRGQQRLNFVWQIGMLGISLAALALPPLLTVDTSLYTTLWIYSLLVGAWYVLAIFGSYVLSGHSTKQPDKQTI